MGLSQGFVGYPVELISPGGKVAAVPSPPGQLTILDRVVVFTGYPVAINIFRVVRVRRLAQTLSQFLYSIYRVRVSTGYPVAKYCVKSLTE